MIYPRTIKAVSAAILLGLLLFLSNTSFVSAFKNKIIGTIKPVLAKTLGIKQAISGSAGDENETPAKAEVARLTAENELLRRALRLGEGKYQLEGSGVVHYRVEFGKEFLFIDKGKGQGVREGDIVVDSFGFLTGTVKEATEAGSHVEIISNPGQALEVEILPLGARALAKGIGARTLMLDLLPQGTPLRKGDFVNLLGIGGVRKSLAVGEVAGVRSDGDSSFMEVKAVIFSKPENLREVFIIK